MTAVYGVLRQRWKEKKDNDDDLNPSDGFTRQENGQGVIRIRRHGANGKRERHRKEGCLILSKRNPHGQTKVVDTTIWTLSDGGKKRGNIVRGKELRAVEHHTQEASQSVSASRLPKQTRPKKGPWDTESFCYYR
jgi:hypothetical protein